MILDALKGYLAISTLYLAVRILLDKKYRRRFVNDLVDFFGPIVRPVVKSFRQDVIEPAKADFHPPQLLFFALFVLRFLAWLGMTYEIT